MFDFKEGTLICKKVDVSDKVMNKINTNIMSDVQNSYRKYLNETIYEDVQYLEELLRPAMTNVIFNLKAEVKPLSELTYRKTLINDPIRSYNVNIWSESNGMKLSDSYLFLKIPYMNDYCQLNMNGALKVVKGQMRPAEEISYSMSEKQMNISMRRANIKIGNTGVAKLFIQYNGKKINLYNIIMAMMYKAGDNTRLDSIFKNTYLVNDMKYSPSTSYQIMHDTVISNTGGYNNSILDKYASEQYSLGAARDAINERLDITRGLNHTLSRDIPGTNYHEGDQVTIDMIEDLKHKRINSYCVVSLDLPEDYVSAKTMNFNEIPQGMKNCNLLRAMFPEHASESYIRETISLTEPMVIYEGDQLTKDVLEFLYNGGFRELTVHTGSSKKDIKISFEREIVGNYTARLGDLVDDIPAGRSADEWVYYYNNPNLDPVDNDKINCHDFIAIASVYGEILLTGKSPLLDRDSSFLKQILLVNDIFSESLREALKEFVAKYRANIIKALSTSQHQASIDPFKSLTKEWIKKMNAFKYLSPIDSVNLAAEISQVNHVVTQVKDASSVSDAMRHLAMPFYGRICPYETPAGKKLGLVNTKALGCSIRDGIPVTYYRKVLRSDSGGIRISDDVIPMTVKDELGKSFSDLLSFKYDENGNIMNTPILARIPNPESIDEPFIFKNIMAYDLRGGYVQAYPEQFLSPTAALIPFACSNDPVRISFGLSQIRQAIYLLKSQAPLVQTNMYKKFFTYSSNDVYQAPVDGIITSISNTDFTITYQDEHGMNNHKIVDISGFDYTGGVSATMQVRKHVGDHVKKGDVIVELQKYPQDFVTRAPFDGIVMDVTREQIVFMKKYRNDGTLASWYPLYQTAIANNQRFDPSSIPTNFEDNAIDYIAVSDGHVKGQSVAFSNIHVAPGDFVHEGDILIDTGVSRGGIYSPSRNPLVIYGCYGYNYEDGVCATESASVEYTSVIAHSIEHEISLKKFSNPIASRLRDSKNKTINFKYCKPNDQIGSIKSHGRGRNNDYEQKVFASVKCHGIPFAVGPSDKQTNADTKIYKFHLLGLNKLGSGDKMSGRHGNKGVVSKVLPDSQAPQLKNGMTARFILNPCGVPSRMNIGQILEAHVSLVANITQTTINSDAFNGATTDDVKQLVRFVWDIANDPSIGTIDNLNRSAYDAICARYPYPKEWTDLVWTHMDNVLDWRGVFYPDGTADVYDPETDSYFNGRMLIGFPMYNKLMQEADEKINARAGALEEEYSYTNSQPNKGSHSAKGQRMAEMELMALAALGTSHFIDEVINDKSDNSGRRQNNTWNQLDINGSDFNPVIKEACYSRSVENLLYFFEAMGVKAETTPDVCDISQEATMVKHDLNLRKFVRDRIKPVRDISSSTPRYSPEDIISAFDDMDD